MALASLFRRLANDSLGAVEVEAPDEGQAPERTKFYSYNEKMSDLLYKAGLALASVLILFFGLMLWPWVTRWRFSSIGANLYKGFLAADVVITSLLVGDFFTSIGGWTSGFAAHPNPPN